VFLMHNMSATRADFKAEVKSKTVYIKFYLDLWDDFKFIIDIQEKLNVNYVTDTKGLYDIGNYLIWVEFNLNIISSTNSSIFLFSTCLIYNSC
jgi:hypothetical protein